MALKSLEIATDGLLKTGGVNSLSMAVRGLLATAVVAAIKARYVGFHSNLGKMMNR